jgi:hypothetical protein
MIKYKKMNQILNNQTNKKKKKKRKRKMEKKIKIKHWKIQELYHKQNYWLKYAIIQLIYYYYIYINNIFNYNNYILYIFQVHYADTYRDALRRDYRGPVAIHPAWSSENCIVEVKDEEEQD